MKIKVYPNPIFDFAIGYFGGFEDVPTKQDKFKSMTYLNLRCDDEDGKRINVDDKLYIINERKRDNQAKFEEMMNSLIKENIKDYHPYKKPLELEVVIGINTNSKRSKEVDLDNLVKCILDCFNGLIYEDDSQITSLIASKYVIKDKHIPPYPGLMIGIRLLTEEKKMINNIPIFLMENVIV